MLTGGRLDVVAIFDKPDPLDGPYFPETIYTTPSRLSVDDQRRVTEMTQRCVDALGLIHGPIHAELRDDGTDVHLIEIAARSIGGLCSKVVRFDDGSGLEDVILRHALGAIDAVPPREAQAAGVMMMQAPRPGRFVRADGVDAARAVSGVDEVIVSVAPGRELLPLPDGFLYVGFIFARADTPAAVEHALRESFAALDIVIDGS